MAETNPYRIEEEKWTPNSVYEILPPNTVSWTNYQYSEGSDNVDTDKAHNSLLTGVVDFFGKLLGGVGKILGGAIEAGVGILGGIVQGVTGLIGGIASAIGSIFGGGNNTEIEPPKPIFNPIKTNLEGAIQPHLDDIEEAKGKIEAAQQEQESIKADIVAQGRDLSTALSKAEKGIADAKAAQSSANKAISDITTKSGELSAEIEAQRQASIARENALKKEINPKIEAAQSKGDSAMSEAEKAVSWLKNPQEIGTSVIAINPETKRPYYADSLEAVENNPPGMSGPTFMAPKGYTGASSYGPNVPVDPKVRYTISFWARADEPGSRIYGQLRTQEGRAVAPNGKSILTGAVSVSNPPQPSNKGEDGKYVHSKAGNSYFIQDLEIPTEWTYYEHELKFDETVSSVSISRMYWNHSKGSQSNQYISGLDIRPQIPTQASVDEAQNEALRAHAEILRQQQEINTLNTAFQEEQKVINATKQELDTLQTEAIKANSKVGETNSTAIEALKAALDSVEQIVGLDNAYRTQQEEIDRQQNERQELIEQIQALQGQMIPRTIMYQDSTPVYDDYIDLQSNKITAKGSWVGELIVDRRGTYKGETDTVYWSSNKRYPIPYLGGRSLVWSERTPAYTRVDYWVYPGKSKRISIEGPSGYVSGATYTGTSWGKIHSFTMPENTGEATLRWETRLLNADRGVTYRLRLLINGTPELTSKWSGKGPLFPWESGVDYLRPVWEIEIPTGATVTIEGSITGSNISSTKAQASHNKGTLTWIEMPKGEE